MATTADDVWRLLGELTQAQKQTQRLLDEIATARQQDEQELTELRQKLVGEDSSPWDLAILGGGDAVTETP